MGTLLFVLGTWNELVGTWGLSIFSKGLLRPQTQAPCHAGTHEFTSTENLLRASPQDPCPWAPPRSVRLFLHLTSSRLSPHPCQRWDSKLLWAQVLLLWRRPSSWSCCSGPLWDPSGPIHRCNDDTMRSSWPSDALTMRFLARNTAFCKCAWSPMEMIWDKICKLLSAASRLDCKTARQKKIRVRKGDAVLIAG